MEKYLFYYNITSYLSNFLIIPLVNIYTFYSNNIFKLYKDKFNNESVIEIKSIILQNLIHRHRRNGKTIFIFSACSTENLKKI